MQKKFERKKVIFFNYSRLINVIIVYFLPCYYTQDQTTFKLQVLFDEIHYTICHKLWRKHQLSSYISLICKNNVSLAYLYLIA